MIYVTGDLHGDIKRFSEKPMKSLKKGDTLIVCGDFGFVWEGSKQEQKNLHHIGKRPYQVLFVEGTHDNYDLLETYPTVSFAGGRARQLSGGCYQLLRGEVYRIEDDLFFTFGGGESPDMDIRTEGKTWWAAELPTEAQMENAWSNLEKHGNVVDYVITHSPSGSMKGFLDMDSMHTDHLEAFLNQVAKQVRFKHWFFGMHHIDKVIPPYHHAVFQEVLPVKAQNFRKNA